MDTIGTVNFEDLFDFSPEPLDSPLEDSDDKQDSGDNKDQFFELTRALESGSNRSQDTSKNQLSSSLPEFQYDVASPEAATLSGTKSKRGRKPGQKVLKSDMKTKLERSRQSARECRARKKLRYQYLDDLLLERERANIKIRDELLKYQTWCHEIDLGRIPEGLNEVLRDYTEEMNNEGRTNDI